MDDLDSPYLATREHIIPRAFGGETAWDNLVAACRECNSLRGHMDAQAFFWIRQQVSVVAIRVIRPQLLAREDRKYRLIARTRVDIAWTFFSRWLRNPQSVPSVET